MRYRPRRRLGFHPGGAGPATATTWHVHPPARAYLELDRKELRSRGDLTAPTWSPSTQGGRGRDHRQHPKPLIRVAIDLLNDRAELQGGMHRPALACRGAF